MNKRDTTISICKAFAIILMVIGHADCPKILGNFLYEFHMPIFFITAGYFFSIKYLNDEMSFIKKRLKGLYLPFLKWAIFFLLIHNWMFDLGILNEKYGNGTPGGVTHPFSFHQLQQNIWNCVSEMGGYDQFLTGAFWFFRGLLVASILYLVLFKLWSIVFRKFNHEMNYRGIGIAICITMLILCGWKTGQDLRIQNLVQGGYRELMGTFYFGCGFLFRQYQDKIRQHWALTLCYFIIVMFFANYYSACMDWKTTFEKFLYSPIPACMGFLMTYNISSVIDHHNNFFKNFMVYCGNNTICIYVFHIISFKLVSLIKIWYYNLDYLQIGCHMVIHEHSKEDLFWIPYAIVGVGLPLVWNYYYQKWNPGILVRIRQTFNLR